LGRHPDPANLLPLLDVRRDAPRDDTHLIHTVRMALRDNLRPAESWKAVASLSKERQDAVADVALGVPTPEAAAFLLASMKDAPPPGEAGTTIVRHVARYGSKETTESLLTLLRKGGTGLDRQFALFRAFEQGTQERGGTLSAEARVWATDLAG